MQKKMTNNRLQTSKDISPLAKRKKVLAGVVQDIVTSEDDDNEADSLDICNIIENHALQPKESATSRALHALGETIRNTLLEINETREQNRERRHREILDALKILIQCESADCGKSETLNTKINNTVHKEEYSNSTVKKNVNDYIIKENVSDKHPFCTTNAIHNIQNSSTPLRQPELIQMPENISSIDETTNKRTNVSSMHIVTAKNSTRASPVIVGKGQVNPVKGAFAVKKDSKEELQKMRAQMLELQRKKMEDREKKKREMQQRLQNNT